MKNKLELLGKIITESIQKYPNYSSNGIVFRFRFESERKVELNQNLLDLKFTIDYPIDNECEINLTKGGDNNVIIFTSEDDFVKRYSKYENSILEYNILLLNTSNSFVVKLANDNFSSENSLIYNFNIYSKLLKFILSSNEFYTFKSDSEKKFVLFYDKGLFEIAYNPLDIRVKNLDDLSDPHQDLILCFEKLEFKKFFKDAVIEGVNRYEVKNRFYHLIESLQVLLSIAKRDHELYLKQFSFDKIKSEFKDKREKYFESIEKNIETVTKQITSFPLTFAATIFAGYQVKDKPAILILVFLGYLLYTIIANKVLSISSFNVNNIKNDVDLESNKIIEYYGSLNDIFKDDFGKINKKIQKLKGLILYLRVILWALIALFIAFGIYEMFFVTNVSIPMKVEIVK